MIAFWDLHTCRTYSEGIPQCISWLAVKEYAQYNDFDLDTLFVIIREMDNAYLEVQHKECNKKIKEATGKTKVSNKK